MAKTVHASRTINPLHFEDLEPQSVRKISCDSLHMGLKQWLRLEDRGKLGNDEGKDILGVEGIISELERYTKRKRNNRKRLS